MDKEWLGKVAGARVLVVDDEPINVEVVKSILHDQFTIESASSGREALKQAVTFLPDAILLDVVLGGMTGIEVCRQLKSNPDTSDIPVLFLTSLESRANEQMCWDAGGVDFILKPVNPDTLLNRLRVHLTLKLQSEYLKSLAFLDGLTGLYNRRYFDEQMRRFWAQLQRNKRPLSVLLMDVDYFKRYNDSLGHLAGDDCLKQVASLLSMFAQRPLDMACRYGGEEFAIILPGSDIDGAIVVAQKVQDGLSRLAIAHTESPFKRVTLSIGVACCVYQGLHSSNNLLQMADERLYYAKTHGRNCIASCIPKEKDQASLSSER
ncbi:diguanylate cyclase [Gilvimarinus sp. SDUM040013]|uniref:diguanylate cyclase n=1 Tax=Gilvimarinus gilvus TaxID=3058038 RepID=A0ABU4RY15_9GAMM|nr:diguanylate cyclase [Gilvimarinus sp. SDUM040013]MDO3386242.1 diguanylate cyclase [Gilvimarinus sp. SDUM040013]MDX6849763.1 diguanylate cyclase [Gilvimarinus sp. SDUM040013]